MDKNWYSVFFTDPKIPFDHVITGGIEENLTALIDSAKLSIDVAVFEFDLEVVAQALIRARLRGVRVRVVYDSQFASKDQQINELIVSGIPAIGDQRASYMHNKFFIFDNETVWTGSLNITINSAYKNNENVIIVRDPYLARNYTLEFEEMFAGRFGKISPLNTDDILMIQGVQVENYFAPERQIMGHIKDLVRKAEHYVHFLAFSFTDRRLSIALIKGLARGIDVKGVFEKRGVKSKYSKYRSLKKHGAQVRLDSNPATMHHKVIIIDGRIVIFGSYNFSSNAAQVNDENLLIIHDPFIAALYEAEFQRIFNKGREEMVLKLAHTLTKKEV